MIYRHFIKPAGGELISNFIGVSIRVCHGGLMDQKTEGHTIAGIHVTRQICPYLVIKTIIIRINFGHIPAETDHFIGIVGHAYIDPGEWTG